MNKAILCGRLTADPTVTYLQSGNDTIAKARFTLAVDRKIKRDGDVNADFISCIAWRKTAEVIEKYVKKGAKVIVEGSIVTGNYTNKDGQKVYTTDINVENVEFAESKAKSEEPKPTPENEPYMSVPDDIDSELPFK